MQTRRNTTKIAKLFTGTLAVLTLASLACVGADAATATSTTITVSATSGSPTSTTIPFTGTATLNNIGSGTFTASANLDTFGTTPTPFTITITTGTTGTLTGMINLANFVSSGTSGSGSATITGGTGNLAGAVGSFPSLTGTLGIGVTFTLTFTGAGTITIGGGGGTSGPPPTVTQVLNNYSTIPAGFVNSGIAQGTLFILKGSNLADPNAQAVLQDPTNGLPSTLNGASVKVTSGGTTVTPVFYYAIASQLALVLPSNTPVSNTATVTVSYGGQTSSPVTFSVVANSFGFGSYNGLALTRNNTSGHQYYLFTDAIPPGTTISIWGSGLGADPPRDTAYGTSGTLAINSLAHLYLGGVDVPILYQGASGYPGLNQLVITIPASSPTGCNVSLVGVNSAGIPTNFTSLAIATGGGACSDPVFGTNGTQIQNLNGQTNVNSGSLYVFQDLSPGNTAGSTTTTNLATGIFDRVTGSSVGTSGGTVSIGGCIVEENGSASTTGTTTPLDAGTITLTGPVGSPVTLQEQTVLGYGEYFAQLAAGAIPSTGGTFTFNATGGTNAPVVGKFSASLTFPNPLLSWTNSGDAATVTRSSGLTVNWNGGSSGTYVIISGSASATVSGQSISGAYTCIAPQSAGKFIVPAYVLAVVPASNSGNTSVSNYTTYQTFTASGLDYGLIFGGTSQNVNTVYN